MCQTSMRSNRTNSSFFFNDKHECKTKMKNIENINRITQTSVQLLKALSVSNLKPIRKNYNVYTLYSVQCTILMYSQAYIDK